MIGQTAVWQAAGCLTAMAVIGQTKIEQAVPAGQRFAPNLICTPFIYVLERWCTTGKRFEINPSFFHRLVSHKKPSNHVFDDIADTTLTYILGQRLESRPFR